MVAMRSAEQDREALAGLFDNLLCHDRAYLESLKADAKKSRLGLPTGMVLKTIAADDKVSDFEIILPKYAITIIAARTGGGKTTTMVDLAVRLAMRGKLGLYVTLEEPAFAINAKMLASYSAHSRPNYSATWLTVREAVDIIAGEQESEYQDGFAKNVLRNVRAIDANKTVESEKIEKPTILYYPQRIADLIEFRNKQSEMPLDFVFIDFGQLLESLEGYSSSYERIRSVMQALKNIAGSTGLAVVIGAQMKRECFGLKIWDWEPELIRDGSDMEQAANMIIATGKDKDEDDPEWNIAYRLLKNRNGPKRVAGMMKVDFGHCHIPDMAREPSRA